MAKATREERDARVRAALERARAGDRAALWEAAEGLRPYLHAVAKGVLGGRLDAKVDTSDVVQQSLLAAIERFAQFRGESPAEWQQWLVAIVRNEARNLLRYWHQDKRNVATEKAIAGSMVEAAAPTEGERPRLPAAQATPSHLVATRREAARLLEVMARLPAEHREVLRLRHFEGLSHGEIAARLGKSPAATRQLWVRALKRLKEAMA
ncbi:MAG TPA: sigma-70 family RNA polymerase sigma factor [Polyangiaceae bacterium LLY-WYZ-15_(1-7)]|nr:sigma-70 family RNA polymerase sigma factor [Polyangiaceae bacterium LLY-WYZ-15_(1-7)]HJL08859.1 sigma-70 family RNA polymerase sigma factor [Polyangiaceae bacterium LLY-WYZ-15_(1-7)]HJL25019.1 sigma-70 family RNA polymerase sigma factor [Polyangiaceae bacterium LLY-WYZ-15_(1-7)]HJL34662.1 sigma-70 family RNA polymerase sigma factor [Polyangiaceae bacterium LLY-WYZ-15_(1-7)]